jgi:hypothetical protein
MTTAGQIIRWSTAVAVIGVAAVAAVASCEHAYALVRAHGETGWIGRRAQSPGHSWPGCIRVHIRY